MQALLRRNINEHVLATPLFGDNAILRKLLANTIRRSTRLINFVNRNNDRNISSLSVVDGLNGLRHNTVVSGNDQNNNIGYLSATGTHSSKRFVARGIDKSNLTTIDVND